MSSIETEAKVPSMEQALTLLGVSAGALQAGEKAALEELGYVVFADAIPQDWLPQLRDLFEDAGAKESGPHARQESGTRHVQGLDQHDLVRAVCLRPVVLAAAYHLMKRRFYLAMAHGRDPLPGFGQQGLHMDWHWGVGDSVQIVTCIALLDDFTGENGATRVVPGTHRLAARPDKRVADPAYVHPRQVIVEGKAGSILVFNGHLLHSATRNRSRQKRRTLQFSFIAYENIRQRMEEPRDWSGLKAEVQFILGERSPALVS